MELTPQNIPDYLRERQREIGKFASDAAFSVQEIGDGNLNFVFRAFDVNQSSNSVVLKQAPPYIKILGPDYKLTPDRLAFESYALEEYNRMVPPFAPHQFYFDPRNTVIVMEDLRGYRILRDELIEGRVNPRIAENIARFMAITHSRTHVHNLTPSQAGRYASRFANDVMQGITADYIFTKPFTSDATNSYTEGLEPAVKAVKTDSVLLNGIWQLKKVFLRSKQGLTHGDLHTGSVMVRADAAKAIDSEFVFYGPVGFDIGLYWANYLLSYFSHVGQEPVRSQLKDAIERTWTVYESEFEMANAVQRTDVLRRIFHESVGFTGMEMMRRLIGAAHVHDIESITDIEKKLSVERAALEFGSRLVKQSHQIETIDALIAMVK